MSYIRSTSNPEGLYIWGDKKNIYIAEGSKKDRIIPNKIFKKLIQKYSKTSDNVTYKGASIKIIFIRNKKQNKITKLFKIPSGDFKIRLSYKNWRIDMWEVTWEYIVNNGLKR